MSDEIPRRDALKIIAAGSAVAVGACSRDDSASRAKEMPDNHTTTTTSAKPTPILTSAPLGFPWQTIDPFLFCVHHDDRYPAGNDVLGPDASLAGRDLGQDFAGIDGWRMYHGREVAGFPPHPHRGFETVTYVRRGLIDHSDSLGATARFGRGDVQWLTAGAGIVHAEMFPLLDREHRNHLELFQIWLNLPGEDKLAAPYFAMLWDRDLPRVTTTGDGGARGEVTVIAGALAGRVPPPPPPSSWASRDDADVAIWHVRLDPGASVDLPPAKSAETVRTLYCFDGEQVSLGDDVLAAGHGAVVGSDAPLTLTATGGADVLVLQGRPIGEPVAQYGPFVMNTRAELETAFADYRRTEFGGWPFPANAPVHARDRGRFAQHADGRVEEATE
jgi:redox-sensitive bicupin YhaK (pirin superfamily)